MVATVVREDDGRAASRRLRALRQPLEPGLAATTSCHHREGLKEEFFPRYLGVLSAFQSLHEIWGKEVRLALRSLSHRG